MMTRPYGGLSPILAMGLLAAANLCAVPRMVVTPGSIGPIYIPAGTGGSVQTVELFNAGDGTLVLGTTASTSWLAAATGSARPCSTHPSDSCIPLQISLNTATLASGTYTGYVTVTAVGAVDSPLRVPVTVTVGNVPGNLTLYVTPTGAASANIYPRSAVTGAVATVTGGSWLAFTGPGAANFTFGNPGVVTVTAQAGQAPGTYSGTVVIAGSTYQPDNQIINVTMVITTSPIIQTNSSSIQLSGYQGGPVASTSFTLNNAGQGVLSISSATATSSAGNFLSASVASANTILVSADPASLTPGIYTGTIGITSNAANNAQTAIPVEFAVLSPGQPVISQGGVVNISTYLSEAVAPGDIVAIFGDEFTANGSFYINPGPPPLATQLGNVQVLVNGVPAPLYYVSRQQINFQMPYTATINQVSTVQVVANGSAGNTRSIAVSPIMPKILPWPSSVAPGNYGVIVNSDLSLAFPTTGAYGGFATHPARRGDTVVVYGIGFGQTSPTATAGAAASSSPFLVNSNVTATVGGLIAPVQIVPAFAGLTPTAVGLYQVNIQLPPDMQTGNSVPLSITVNGNVSNTVNIPVSAN